jgi:hypothetical protein
MPEKVKRLTPKPETLRELFLKSGNQCAFPGCSRLMMNEDGDFVGQICHIEAAETGGERFNPKMTNEARRSIKNLMLMCHEHHVVTNNVAKYPAAALQKMKKEHEAKFTSVEKKMLKAIEDQTKAITPGASASLAKIAATLKWDLPNAEREERVTLLAEMVEKFRRVPLRSRQLFAIILERAEWANNQDSSVVVHNEIREACGLTNAKVIEHISVLEKYKLVQADYHEYRNPDISVGRIWGGKFHSMYGWTFWEDLKEFCAETGIPLTDFITDLRFNLLD